MPREPLPLAPTARVLVVRLDNLGDVVLAGPLFRELRRALPAATLGLLASPGGARAAALLPWIDEVIEARPAWQDLGARLPLDPERELSLMNRLADGRWDAVLIATSFRQTAWVPAYAAYLAGIPRRIGFAADFGGSVLTDQVAPPPVEAHQAIRNLALLDPLGIPAIESHLEIRIPTEARAEVDRRLNGALRGADERGPGGRGAADAFVLLVPGASAPARRYSAARWARAASWLGAQTGREVVMATTPAEAPMREEIQRIAPEIRTIGDDLTVPAFAALVERAGVVLCGNSLALHLGDALGRPVVAAYSGTDLVSQWRPRDTVAALLQRDVECSPCYLIECPIGTQCLDLAPEEIVEAALDVLAAEREPNVPAPAGGVPCAA